MPNNPKTPHQHNNPYHLTNGKSAEEPIERLFVDGSERVLVRVRSFYGDSIKEQALQFSNADTLYVKDILTAILMKMKLKEEFFGVFSLWMSGQDLMLQLRPNQDIFEVVSKWHLWNERYTHNPKCEDPDDPANEFFFLFKREALLPLHIERKINDELVVMHLYGEARQNVVSGLYPFRDVTDIVTLAAFQSQILFGDYQSDKHQPGFLVQAISDLIPPYFLKAVSSFELELLIFNEWRQHQGKAPQICRLLYLQYVRQLPCYSSTFFPACKTLPPEGFFEKRREHLMIGVNHMGIQVVDLDKHRVLLSQTFDNIHWDKNPDSFVLRIKSDMESPQQQYPNRPPPEVLLITPQAVLVNNVANKAVLMIKEESRALDKQRQFQQRLG